MDSVTGTRQLSWSRDRWLYRPTLEEVDDRDPRVPRSIDAAKKHRHLWLLTGSQANVDEGFYRRDMDMDTAGSTQPTYVATWQPHNGDAKTLVRGTGDDAYKACVKHYQATHADRQRNVPLE